MQLESMPTPEELLLAGEAMRNQPTDTVAALEVTDGWSGYEGIKVTEEAIFQDAAKKAAEAFEQWKK